MQKIVLATNNEGKLKEFNALFSSIDLNIVSQKNYAVLDVEETGLTFVENALLKARHACKATGLPAIADDSGLIVDALNGAPGIYSARYAGVPTDANKNIDKLLTNLKDTPTADRTARFYCCLVYLKHEKDPEPLIAEGVWEGSILTSPVGQGGFGYDPVFYVTEKNCSSAELTAEQKHLLSHRAKAMKKLLQQFKEGVGR